MAKYRKRAVVIEAVRYDGDAGTLNSFIGESYGAAWYYASDASGDAIIPTLEGKMRASVGDWVVKGVEGEFYPCKDSIFRKTYEPVESDAT